MTSARYVDVKRGRLTDEEFAQLDALAERGLTPSKVAQKLNRHPATINWQFIVRGHREFDPNRRGRSYKRGGVEVRAFSAEEDAFIEQKRAEGWSFGGIAEQHEIHFGFKRSDHTIGMRLKMLACAA